MTMNRLIKLVLLFALTGMVAGNRSAFASGEVSPDNQWEYQRSDDGQKAQLVNKGTTQGVLDLSNNEL